MICEKSSLFLGDIRVIFGSFLFVLGFPNWQTSCRISSILYWWCGDDLPPTSSAASVFPSPRLILPLATIQCSCTMPLTRTHTHPYTCICIFSVICICICSLYSFLQHCNAAFYKATKSFSFFSKLRYLYICHSICICIWILPLD